MGAFIEHQVDGVAILLWACSPQQPHLLHTPFFFAAAAAALDVPVEMYFTADSVHLLVAGVAARLQAPHHHKTVAQAMADAAEAGVRFLVCTDALRTHGLHNTPLIPQVHGHGGAVQYMARAADLRWKTLVF